MNITCKNISYIQEASAKVA